MNYARTTFSFFAILFLIGLGVFSIFQNSRSRVNRVFALYCLCNLTWNSTDFVIFIRNQHLGLWFYRMTGIAGCFIAPTLLHFVYTIAEISEHKIGRALIKISYTIGTALAILCLTPFIFKEIHYEPFKPAIVEIAGFLYPVFASFFLAVLVAVGVPVPWLLKKRTGVKRIQLVYILLALMAGLLALLTYLWSFSGHDWPWAYYPFQSLAGFSFAYSIFKYDLIPARIAFRRATLLLGIYVAIGMALIPIVYWFYSSVLETGTTSIELTIIFALIVGAICSLGPLVYSGMVRHYSLFQDQIASQITHEFKTPLATIQSAREVIEQELKEPNKNPQKLKDYMAIIERNTDRLQKFVAEVLDFNRFRGVADDVDKAPIDLKDICQDALRDFPRQDFPITFRCDGVAIIRGSREGMKQVFSNLISNAVKFCPEGKIDISIIESEGRLLVSIQDEGAGIPKHHLERIFDPFFKTEAPTHIAGSGLGLSIVKKWIEFHNGTIWAESAGEVRGTTIRFTLPIK